VHIDDIFQSHDNRALRRSVHSAEEDLMPDGNNGTFASNSILDKFHASGASLQTARQDKLTAGGPDASRTMAKTDQGRIKPLKARFNAVAAQTGLPPALLAAVASRESRCGNVLDPNDGTGDDGNAFGIMQVDKRSHTIKGEARPEEPGAYPAGIRDPAGLPEHDRRQIPGTAARAPAPGGGRSV
jgi:hypothetical protein